MVDLLQSLPTNVVATNQFSTILRTAYHAVFPHNDIAIWKVYVSQLDTTDSQYVQQFMSSSLKCSLRTIDDQPFGRYSPHPRRWILFLL